MISTNSLVKNLAFEIGPFLRDHWLRRYEWFCRWCYKYFKCDWWKACAIKEISQHKDMILPALGLKSFEKRVCASIKWAFIHQKGRKNHISTKVSPVIFTVYWKAANRSHFQQASGYIKFPDICNLIVCTNSLIKDFAFEIRPFVRDHFFGRYEWFCAWWYIVKTVQL